MTGVRVTSRQHPVVRRCRTLAAGRDRTGAVLLDGEHLVLEALATGVRIDSLLTDGRHPDLVARVRSSGAEIYDCNEPVLAAASPVRSPGGVVAIASWTPATPDRVLERPAASPVIGLVGVQDPGNVGSVIRSADAFGASGVLALDGTADPGGWKALRGAMGSTFRVPVARGTLDDVLPGARRRGLRVAATVARHGTPLDTAPLDAPLLVLLGHEGGGLPEAVVSSADIALTVPMREGLDSLNVAVTAALILWEARRQRAGAPDHSR